MSTLKIHNLYGVEPEEETRNFILAFAMTGRRLATSILARRVFGLEFDAAEKFALDHGVELLDGPDVINSYEIVH